MYRLGIREFSCIGDFPRTDTGTAIVTPSSYGSTINIDGSTIGSLGLDIAATDTGTRVTTLGFYRAAIDIDGTATLVLEGA